MEKHNFSNANCVYINKNGFFIPLTNQQIYFTTLQINSESSKGEVMKLQTMSGPYTS